MIELAIFGGLACYGAFLWRARVERGRGGARARRTRAGRRGMRANALAYAGLIPVCAAAVRAARAQAELLAKARAEADR